MNALDETDNIAGAAEHKAAGRGTHFAFQPLPAGKEPHALEPLETGKKLVGHLQPGCRHVHEPRSGEIVQGPQRRDRKDNGSFSAVLGAGGRAGLASCAPQKNLTLPIVKVGESDPVGKLQNGDKLRHAF
jgi:hypothetical protein